MAIENRFRPYIARAKREGPSFAPRSATSNGVTHQSSPIGGSHSRSVRLATSTVPGDCGQMRQGCKTARRTLRSSGVSSRTYESGGAAVGNSNEWQLDARSAATMTIRGALIQRALLRSRGRRASASCARDQRARAFGGDVGMTAALLAVFGKPQATTPFCGVMPNLLKQGDRVGADGSGTQLRDHNPALDFCSRTLTA